jgi:hypothetical protein
MKVICSVFLYLYVTREKLLKKTFVCKTHALNVDEIDTKVCETTYEEHCETVYTTQYETKYDQVCNTGKLKLFLWAISTKFYEQFYRRY